MCLSTATCYDEIVWGRAAGRVAGRAAGRYGREFLKHTVPAVAKPARTLWNDFIAFLFFCFGGLFGIRAFHLARDLSNAPQAEAGGAVVRLAIAGFCTLLMLGFGLTSYLRARRISRS